MSKVLYSFFSPQLDECLVRIAEVNNLLHQLSETSVDITPDYLSLVAKHCRLLFATQDNRLLGMATLLPQPILSGMSGVVHDVVVDKSARGQHLGRELTDR